MLHLASAAARVNNLEARARCQLARLLESLVCVYNNVVHTCGCKVYETQLADLVPFCLLYISSCFLSCFGLHAISFRIVSFFALLAISHFFCLFSLSLSPLHRLVSSLRAVPVVFVVARPRLPLPRRPRRRSKQCACSCEVRMLGVCWGDENRVVFGGFKPEPLDEFGYDKLNVFVSSV